MKIDFKDKKVQKNLILIGLALFGLLIIVSFAKTIIQLFIFLFFLLIISAFVMYVFGWEELFEKIGLKAKDKIKDKATDEAFKNISEKFKNFGKK